MMTSLLARGLRSIGAAVLEALSYVGLLAVFYGKLSVLLWSVPSRPRLLLSQLYVVGSRSLAITLVSGLFVGFVLGLQGYYTLNRYGAEQALGLLVALSLVRELGPVVAALLFAGRAGTALTAEVGLMKAGEQLDAIAMMGIDPLQRILAPRFAACLIAMPLLAALFSAIGIGGGYVVGVVLIGVDSGAFWAQMQSGVDVVHDVGSGVLKSFVFGWICGATALTMGWFARPTPEGVSQASTRAVVASSLS
ncbi:MAG: lipid asymmetry maintenance ABC transporter permease subunit MlaE, partial [Betaproteobacteria bacterium]|nr:lipid asymmetry maintenance ABC transporter permease subunit MlaE [Betaproteobacteria bacterium]